MENLVERWFWLISATLAVAAVMVLHRFVGVAPSSAPIPDSAATDSQPVAVPQTPIAAERHPGILPTMRAVASVYECRTPQGLIYSDRSCGRGSHQRDIQAPNRMDPQDTSILNQPVTLQNAQPSSTAPSAVAAPPVPSQCAAIEAAKNAIDARMRAGYSNQEGEQLRERLRQLSDEWYELRCRHFH